MHVPLGRQYPQHPGFVAPDRPYDCRQCINWHSEKLEFPDLDEDNFEPWEMYFRLQGQQRAGGFDTLGLDYGVLPVAFDIYEVPRAERRQLFEELCLIDGEVNRWRARKRETEERLAKMKRGGK